MLIGCPSCQVPAGAAELHPASSKTFQAFGRALPNSLNFNALSLSNGDGDAFLWLLLPSFALPFPFQVGRIEDDRGESLSFVHKTPLTNFMAFPSKLPL